MAKANENTAPVLEGNFFEQFVSKDEKKAAEKAALDIIKKEKAEIEGNELLEKLKREVARLFIFRRNDSDEDFHMSAYNGSVTVCARIKKVAESGVFPGLKFTVLKNSSSFSSGEIAVAWAKKPAVIECDGLSSLSGNMRIKIRLGDADFDKRLKMIFMLAKATLHMKPQIRGD